MRTTHPIVIAKAILSRHIPQSDTESVLAVADAQKVVADALRAGDVRACAWLLEVLSARLKAGLDGIVGQLACLLDDACEVIAANPQLAPAAIFLARDLNKPEVMQAALRSARLGMHGQVAPLRGIQRPQANDDADETGHHSVGRNYASGHRVGAPR
jgi:hypothetical protein